MSQSLQKTIFADSLNDGIGIILPIVLPLQKRLKSALEENIILQNRIADLEFFYQDLKRQHDELFSAYAGDDL